MNTFTIRPIRNMDALKEQARMAAQDRQRKNSKDKAYCACGEQIVHDPHCLAS